MSVRIAILPVVGVLFALSASVRAEDALTRRALLIGVTAYPNIGKEFQLHGGANDVAVIARVLQDKFGFGSEDLKILSEHHGRSDESRLPTRKNIEAAFAQLAEGIRQGDQVVVFLAGHGTALPTKDGPAGYFLPRDVQPWKGEGDSGSVPNAIAGTEIGTWLRPVAEQRANLWVIVDACFTGRMVRGGAGTVRQLPTDPDLKGGLQVPRHAIREGAKRGTEPEKPPIPLPNYEGVACLYACSPDEVTLEERPVAGDSNSPVLGLLTRALGDVLLNASSELTYRELHLLIRKFYASTGRSSPTPVVEGAAINRTVLQSKVLQRKSFIIGESDDGDLAVNAGLLHGLTLGSILSIYPPPGGGDTLKGYVKLTRVGSTTSECEPYAETVSQLVKKASLIGGRAEVHRIEYGENRLPVAIDPIDSEGSQAFEERIAQLRKMLQEMSAEKSATFRLTDSLAEARLILKRQDDNVYVVPSLFQIPSAEAVNSVLDSHKVDADLRSWLRGKLEQVSRAHALLRLHADSGRNSVVKISTNLLRLESATSKTGKPIDGAVKRIRPGDYVAYEIKNQGDTPIDVTILYLDAKLDIDALFPSKNEFNRILPGESLPLYAFRVNAETNGSEFAVIIAVENRGKELIELTALAPSRRSVTASAKQLDTPLGRLLNQSLTTHDKKRAVPQSLIRSYTVDLVAIQIMR